MTLTPQSENKATKRPKKSQLRIVLDTNALYVPPTNVGSASDLIRQEIANVIVDAKYPDLDISWYLPEIVRHERQYQMQVEALKLRPSINKIERLLSHNLALTDQILLDHVKTKIDEKEAQLGLQEIKMDHNLVDWAKLIRAAAYRDPPFEPGEKEKGFRDALVAESFLQLLAASPKSPSLCRVVLLTSDALLTLAINERTADSANVSVFASVEQLKELINTIVSNVGEDFIGQIKPRAAKLFFVSSEDKGTIFYRENIRDQLSVKFKSELEKRPQHTIFRQNGTWHIDQPNFSKKVGRRVFWTSRIEIEVEAGIVAHELETSEAMVSRLGSQKLGSSQGMALKSLADISTPTNVWPGNLNLADIYSASPLSGYYLPEKRVTTYTGKDIFEVQWSTDVTMAKVLKKPVIEDIVHVGLVAKPDS